MSDLFQAQLPGLRACSLHRKLRDARHGPGTRGADRRTTAVQFFLEDYLGLAANPIPCQAAIEAIEEFGVGAGASRLISGTRSPPHIALESALACWMRAPAAVYSIG